MVLNVAIVEDEQAAADVVVDFLGRYTAEKGVEFAVRRFGDAVGFLENYRPKYDIVFMDIQLPDLDGMEASKKLRRLDRDVTLIFVTNMANFAVKGYEVDALDFIVKPVEYFSFSVKLDRAVTKTVNSAEKEIFAATETGTVRLKASQIKYVEIMKHTIVYHTTEGDFCGYGSLKNVEQMLPASWFVRCNNCYLVNLRYVKSINGFSANVGGDELMISHAKKKDFMKALNEYIGMGVGGGY